MSGGEHFLLLAVLVFLPKCHQKPNVFMSPELMVIYNGDLFYLSCTGSGGKVKWYINNVEQTTTKETWKIPVASPKHSGFYQCESNGQKSDTFPIKVLEFIPLASLSIETGHPVMKTGYSVILKLDYEDGLQGWKCWVYRRENNEMKRINLRLQNNESVIFQSSPLQVPETIFWCTDHAKQQRSNQIVVRTSDKAVSLEMYPLPAVVSDNLILRCLVWGTDEISNIVFYKDNAIIIHAVNPTYTITDVTESTQGKYKCDATYKYKGNIDGSPNHRVSDTQDVLVQEPPIKAVLSEKNGLSCSCSICSSNTSYRWYRKSDDQQWASMGVTEQDMKPNKRRTYACRAMWPNGRSFLSNSFIYPVNNTNKSLVSLLLILILALLAFLAFCFYKWYKRNSTGPVYEDVALREKDKNYETLQVARGAQMEAMYDTLNPGAPATEKKEGPYEALKKEGMKEGAYSTLGMEDAGGAEGGYEALKKEGMKEGVYHTLGMEWAGGVGGHKAEEKMAKDK